MRLLNCTQCHDIFNLKYNDRYCDCGNSGGKLIEGIIVEYFGPARVIHINTEDYEKAKPAFDKTYPWHIMMDGAHVNKVEDKRYGIDLLKLLFKPRQE
jgi:hypothetical protein